MNQGLPFRHGDFEIAMTAAAKITLNNRAGPAGLGGNVLAPLPGIVDVRIVMEVVDKGVIFDDNDFEVAVAAAAEIALYHGGGAGCV